VSQRVLEKDSDSGEAVSTIREMLDLMEVGGHKECAPWEQPVYTQEKSWTTARRPRMERIPAMKAKKNPGELSCEERLADALRERDEDARKRIAKIRRGK
jgi:hypothetical protein